MVLPEEDSDEEWARIAESVNLIEAQYIAARNIASIGDTPTPNPPTTSINNHVTTFQPPASTSYVQPQPEVTNFPNEQARPPILQDPAENYPPPLHAHSGNQASSFSHHAQQALHISGAGPPYETPPRILEIGARDIPSVVSGGVGTTLGVVGSKNNGGEHGAPLNIDGAGNGAPKLSEEDSFAQLLVQKETALYELREELKGVQTNFRNKIRSLQKELHDARSSMTSSSIPTSNPASLEKVTQLTEEKARLQKELEDARNEARKHSEALHFSQQELANLKDRERKHLAALRARSNPVSEDASLPLPVVPALTQPGDVVEGTQMPNVGLSQKPGFGIGLARPTNRRRRRSSLPKGASGSGTGLSSPGTRQVVKSESQPEVINRKRGRGDVIKDEDGVEGTASALGTGSDSRSKLGPSQNVTSEDVHHGWGIDFQSHTWADQSLREHLFKTGLGDRLIVLAQRTGREELRQGVVQALAGERCWTGALDALTSTIFIGRAVCLTALQAADILVTYNDECRRYVAALSDNEHGLIATCVNALDIATRRADPRVAELCLQILQAGVAGASEVSEGGEFAESASIKVCTAILRTDSWMNWVSGSAGVRGKEGRNKGVEGGEGCRIAAWRLMGEVCGLAVETQSHIQDSEWSMLEKSYAEAAEFLEKGGDDDAVELAIGMMTRASGHAPYLVTDLGGAEALCCTLGRLLRWLQSNEEIDREDLEEEFASEFEAADLKEGEDTNMSWTLMERRRVVGLIRAAVGALVLTGAGMGGKLGLSASGRIVGMGALALLGWHREGWAGTPTDVVDDIKFRDECRKAWSMVAQSVEMPSHANDGLNKDDDS